MFTSKNLPVNKFLPLPPPGLTCQVIPFFKLTRYLSRCPLTFEYIRNKKQVKFKFKLSSISFVLSLISALFLHISLAIGHIQYSDFLEYDLFQGSGIWPPDNSIIYHIHDYVSGFSYGLVNSISTLYVIISAIDYLLAFLKAPELSKSLNNWNEIDDDMRKMDMVMDKIAIKNFIIYFITFFEFVPTLFFASMVTVSRFDVRYPINSVLSMIYGYLPHTCYAVEDSQALIMLKCLQVEFRQVRNHIEKYLSEGQDQLPIRKIHQILIKLRSKAKLCGEFLAPQELLSIFLTMYTTAGSFFLFVTMFSNPSVDRSAGGLILIAFASIWPLFGISRLVVKIWVAVSITKEEMEIASLLKNRELQLKLGTWGTDYSSEVRRVYNLLTSSPTEVSFNNYVKLNNALILGAILPLSRWLFSLSLLPVCLQPSRDISCGIVSWGRPASKVPKECGNFTTTFTNEDDPTPRSIAERGPTHIIDDDPPTTTVNRISSPYQIIDPDEFVLPFSDSQG
ncbi:hypothetical protein Fcan01_10486 [Folsomia candida]|uniref:Uncharacterized protein n=1 Tax=Folsomia candida TaxID=158441 RepID=A0A226E9B5_FOLCA|nr:hypothetical protein Fcan01_10486 [Folsomia candida]